MTKPADPLAPLRSRSYLALLALAAIIGVPVSAAAFGFLALVNKLQGWIFTSLPRGLGLHATPVWWPIPLLVISGVLVALAIRYLPGSGGLFVSGLNIHGQVLAAFDDYLQGGSVSIADPSDPRIPIDGINGALESM